MNPEYLYFTFIKGKINNIKLIIVYLLLIIKSLNRYSIFIKLNLKYLGLYMTLSYINLSTEGRRRYRRESSYKSSQHFTFIITYSSAHLVSSFLYQFSLDRPLTFPLSLFPSPPSLSLSLFDLPPCRRNFNPSRPRRSFSHSVALTAFPRSFGVFFVFRFSSPLARPVRT